MSRDGLAVFVGSLMDYRLWLSSYLTIEIFYIMLFRYICMYVSACSYIHVVKGWYAFSIFILLR